MALQAVSDMDSEEVVVANTDATATTAVVDATFTTAAGEETTTTTAPSSATTIDVEVASAVQVASIAVSDRELNDAVARLAEAQVVDAFGDVPAYSRDSYTGDGWPDSDGDCQSDRHEILIEESLVDPVLDSDGCRVETGLWVDAYDGTEYTVADLVTIDHVIPLAAAHRAGAWAWDDESKRAFASDISFPATHVGVGGDVNQAKGDSGPEDWRPPNEGAWCRYAVDWISVKDRWSLAFTTAEVDALVDMLGTCDPVTGINALGATAVAPAVVSPSTTSPPTDTTAPTPSSTTTTSSTTSSTAAPEPVTSTPTSSSSTTSTSSSTSPPTVAPATVAPATVAPTTAAPDCHPNYTPCIPNLPGDALNCGDIRGSVRVNGGDPYRLDRDGDGIGCDA